jgi:1-acyl-sn-glycerol-3-phosphate acyltransferase
VIARRLRFVTGFLGGALWLLVCCGIGFLVLPFGRRSRLAVRVVAKLLCGGIAAAMGWRVRVENAEQLTANRPCVFVANHQSFLDVILFGTIVPPATVAAGKKEIAAIPFFGWFFRASGNILLDRGNRPQTTVALHRAADVIRRDRISVWMMPEGHRNDGHTLLPFRSGAFRLAAQAGVPVVPVVAEPVAAVADTGRLLTWPGTFRVRVLEPIATDDADTPLKMSQLVDRARHRMQSAFDELALAANQPRP